MEEAVGIRVYLLVDDKGEGWGKRDHVRAYITCRTVNQWTYSFEAHARYLPIQ